MGLRFIFLLEFLFLSFFVHFFLLSGVPDIASPLLTVLLSPWAGARGSYDTILYLFVFKLAISAALLAFFALKQFEWNLIWLAVFVTVCRTLTQTTFSFFNMSVSDIIDEDYHKVFDDCLFFSCKLVGSGQFNFSFLCIAQSQYVLAIHYCFFVDMNFFSLAASSQRANVVDVFRRQRAADQTRAIPRTDAHSIRSVAVRLQVGSARRLGSGDALGRRRIFGAARVDGASPAVGAAALHRGASGDLECSVQSHGRSHQQVEGLAVSAMNEQQKKPLTTYFCVSNEHFFLKIICASLFLVLMIDDVENKL